MRHPSTPRSRSGSRWRVAAAATATTLAVGAVSFWLRDEPAATGAGPALAPLPPSVSDVASGTGLADRFTLPGDTAAEARQADLSPLPETLRQPVAGLDAVARVRQRHAMSRFFTDAQDIERARGDDVLMVPAVPAEAIAGMGILSERQKSDGRAFMRYELRTLESRVEGDPLDIFLPNLGLTAKAVVDRVESVDGLLRWSGHFVDLQEGGTFSVTHALGDRYAVGTFDTPMGSFSMEARNGWGWVAPPSSDFSLPAGHDDGVQAPLPPAPPEQAAR
ncbi:MAG TPA: metalloprotease secretion chaperone CpaB [Variovorax sp.]|nr:metalloprotease secretion chaperone CpaB [Variovorax sp.]